ncbi:MAG: hypothetical protein ABMB14_05355 [Myxococcota bacterium]
MRRSWILGVGLSFASLGFPSVGRPLSGWLVATASADTPPAPADAAAGLSADISVALEAPKKAKWDPKGKAIDPFGRGDAKRKQEAWGEAIPLLVESLDAQPGCGKCLSSLSKALVGANRHEDAVRVGELMVKLYPDRKEGWERVSDAWNDADAHEAEAIEATTKFLELDKANSNMWWRRNRLLVYIGQFDTAEGWLTKATEAGLPKEDTACLRVQLLAAKGDPVAARDLWSTCDQGDAVELRRYTEGWLALTEGDTETAAKRLMLAGADDFAELTIAYLRLEQQKYDLAANLTTKLLEDTAWPLDAHLARALALHGLGKDDEARQELEANLMGDGWVEKHKAFDLSKMLLKPKGEGWPKSVGLQAAALEVALLTATGDAAGAKSVYDAAVGLYGDVEQLKAVAPPAAAATAVTP